MIFFCWSVWNSLLFLFHFLEIMFLSFNRNLVMAYWIFVILDFRILKTVWELWGHHVLFEKMLDWHLFAVLGRVIWKIGSDMKNFHLKCWIKVVEFLFFSFYLCVFVRFMKFSLVFIGSVKVICYSLFQVIISLIENFVGSGWELKSFVCILSFVVISLSWGECSVFFVCFVIYICLVFVIEIFDMTSVFFQEKAWRFYECWGWSSFKKCWKFTFENCW